MEMNCLMLGVGVDQIIAIEEAHKMGIKVIGFDGNPEAAGKDKCDHFEAVDIKDAGAVEEKAMAWNKKIGIDGVIAPAVEAGPAVGRVVDKLGLVGIGERVAEKLTWKEHRYILLDNLSILQPKWQWRSARVWMGGLKKNDYPIVIKPSNQSAAVGVKLIETPEQLEGEEFDVAQEYLEGWELSTEVLVFDHGQKIIATADRNYDKKLKWKPYLLEDGCQFPSKISPKIHCKINNIVDKLIRELKLSSCAIKLDLLVKDNLVYVIEVAPRLGGGKLSSVMIPNSTGINWWRLAIKLAMGLPIKAEECMPTKHLFSQLFSAQRYKFPDNPKSHKDRLGSVEVTAKTYEEAVKKAEEKVKEL